MFARTFAAAALLTALPALAQQAAPPAPAQPTPAPPAAPKLIVAIAVDQLSSDVFAEYRQHFTGGLARLANGVVFPSGYQSHAATETCPGHSTILTGTRPARNGIIANDWVDLKTARADKTVYCAEDERVPGSSSSSYTVSPVHLKVPTLGERMKQAVPATRVVAVAGKDRAAVMMAGRNPDQIWWWGGKGFVSYAGRPANPLVDRFNAALATQIAAPRPALDLPDFCRSRDVAVPIGGGKTVGTGRFAREGGDVRGFRASPEFDEAVIDLAGQLFAEMKLGQGRTTDLLIVGASASDYVGHTYGTEGTEMCLQLFGLDRALGMMFEKLDASGVDYQVMLTADHGGHDLPERHRMHGITEAARVDAAFNARAIGTPIARKLGIEGQLLWGGNFGDMWVDPTIDPGKREPAMKELYLALSAHPQVQAVMTRDQILATPGPSGPPETWTLLQRARASYVDGRSGDFVVALKPRITPIASPLNGYTSTHGSFWDYDRRVPILFWRKGTTGFEQPLSVETVDILPTLAALIGLKVPGDQIDGRCLDLDAGTGTTCPAH